MTRSAQHSSSPARARGTCPRCGRKRVALRANGRLWTHTDPNDTRYSPGRCHGSNHAPLV